MNQTAKRMTVILATGILLLMELMTMQAKADDGARKAELEHLRTILPACEYWENWLKQTGELPPDFDAMEKRPGLRDPLIWESGRRVNDAADWEKRRLELLQQFHHYILGTVPAAPGNIQAHILSERVEADGSKVREIELRFGPDHKAKLGLELLIPGGDGPFPVLLTQTSHRKWAVMGVARGYLGCVFRGSDRSDDTEAFREVWPEYDWGTLVRRAWGACRCIDYLQTVREADTTRIAMTGHSRNGKQSVMAAAMDTRIGAVVSSSSGSGGVGTFRMCDEGHFSESIERMTGWFSEWFVPRLRFFSGREALLPVDMHELVALVAPRACLISTALNDNCEAAWSSQQTYLAARGTFEFLGEPDHLGLRWRSADHATAAEDVEAYFDWFDYALRDGRRPEDSALIYPLYDQWKGTKPDPRKFEARQLDDILINGDGNKISDAAAWQMKKSDVRKRIEWALGDAPARVTAEPGGYGSDRTSREILLRHQNPFDDIVKEKTAFGEYLSGDWYYPKTEYETDRKLPCVIWLHPFSYPEGYLASYLRGTQPYIGAARAGYATFAYDQIGFGYRVLQAEHFYDRYPDWSLLGKMVRDCRSAVDAALQNPRVDPERIYLVGFELGAMVALHEAALDERIAGVVSISGITSMRRNTTDRGMGGLARIARWYMLQPRLAAFEGQESRVPYDYHEVLAMIAPRPVFLITPEMDRHSSADDVKTCVEQARQVYQLYHSENRLHQKITDDYARMNDEIQAWLWPEMAQVMQPR